MEGRGGEGWRGGGRWKGREGRWRGRGEQRESLGRAYGERLSHRHRVGAAQRGLRWRGEGVRRRWRGRRRGRRRGEPEAELHGLRADGKGRWGGGLDAARRHGAGTCGEGTWRSARGQV